MAARPGSDEDESCAVGSSFSRSFQRLWMCRDQSLVAGEPRITVPELWAARGGAWRRVRRLMGLILSRLGLASLDLSNGCRGVVIGVL